MYELLSYKKIAILCGNKEVVAVFDKNKNRLLSWNTRNLNECQLKDDFFTFKGMFLFLRSNQKDFPQLKQSDICLKKNGQFLGQ